MNKWGKNYWADLGERVGSTLVQTVLAQITAVSTTSWTWNQAWIIVGIPTVISLLKGLLANLGSAPSASAIGVTSSKEA